MRNTHFHRSIGFWAGAILLAGIPLALTGCGGSDGSGSSGSSSPTPLSGNTAIQAPIIAGYQAFIGGINYPFHQVQSTLPNGSPFKAALAAAFKRRTGSAMSSMSLKPSLITGPDPLGLYENETKTSTTDMVTYSTDAAGTKSVGTLAIGYPAGTTLGTYSSYPVDFTINANLTSGPLPFTGNGTITLQDSSGKGEIKGSFSIPASKVMGSADLLLSDTGNVTGTATVTENGQTLTLTNVNGPIDGTLTGNVAVAPQGYTGTATLSIVTGSFNVTLKTSSGTATGVNNSSGALVITLPNSSTVTFTNPLSALPTSMGTTGGGGTGGGGTGGGAGTGGLQYDTPVDFVNAEAIVNNSGHVIDGLSLTQIIYQTAIKANLQTILTPHGDLDVPVAFNNKDAFILVPFFGSSNTNVYVYAGPNASPTVLPGGSSTNSIMATALNDSGRIVGFETNNGANLGALTWASATASPTLLPPPSTTITKGGDTFTISGTNITVSGITNADTLKLTAVKGSSTLDSNIPVPVTSGKAIYDSSVSGYFLIVPGTYTVTVTPYLKGVAGTSVTVTLSTTATNIKATGINNSSAIVGIGATDPTGYGQPLYWSSPTAPAQVLASVSNPSFNMAGINLAGQIFATDPLNGVAYYWSSPTATPIKLPGLSGYPMVTATAINSGGTICGYCTDSGGQNSRAVIWRGGKVTDLNTLFPATTGFLLSQAKSINDSNLIICNNQAILIH